MPTVSYQDTDFTLSLNDERLEISVSEMDCTESDDWDRLKLNAEQIRVLFNFLKINITGLK